MPAKTETQDTNDKDTKVEIWVTPHAVHVPGEKFEYDDEPVRTYDRERAAKNAKPAGEDVVPAHKVMDIDPDTGHVLVMDVPEVRTPYWNISNPTTRYVGPTQCPDCGEGLTSTEHAMVCHLIPIKHRGDVEPCHEFCVIACAVDRRRVKV